MIIDNLMDVFLCLVMFCGVAIVAFVSMFFIYFIFLEWSDLIALRKLIKEHNSKKIN